MNVKNPLGEELGFINPSENVNLQQGVTPSPETQEFVNNYNMTVGDSSTGNAEVLSPSEGGATDAGMDDAFWGDVMMGTSKAISDAMGHQPRIKSPNAGSTNTRPAEQFAKKMTDTVEGKAENPFLVSNEGL